jgi:co-chaperonin GroES (HSP10)
MSVIPFQPIGDVVIVLPEAPARPETDSGIVLADVHYDPSTSGTVVAIGSHFSCPTCEIARDRPFAIGDRVVFGRGAGAEIDGASVGVPGETFLLLREAEVLAIVTAEAVCEVV